MGIIDLGTHLKRKVVGKLTENSVGKEFSNRENIKKILISRPNHRLGNLLLSTPMVLEVTRLFPGCRIDLFVSGHHAPTIFKEYRNVDRIISLPRKPGKDLLRYAKGWLQLRKVKYDLVINAETQSSSGRLASVFANASIRFVADETVEEQSPSPDDEKHMAKHSIYALRKFLRSLPMEFPELPIPLMDIKLSPAELERGRQLVRQLVPGDSKIICVFTNATGDKCYSETWWMHFYDLLKSDFPEYEVMEVLPVENVSRIQFQAPSLYSKDIREMGAVMANASVLISGDCGVMHLASASLTPTLGLFNLDRLHLYGPYGNNSASVNTNLQSAEEIIEVLKKVLSENSSPMVKTQA